MPENVPATPDAVRSPPPPEREATFSILSINDVYEIDPSNGVGGLAQLRTMLTVHERELEARGVLENSLFVVPGDFLSASAAAEVHKGAHMVDIFNRLGVGAVCFGNHEFDDGAPELRKRVAESRFPWLGANVVEARRFVTEEAFYDPAVFSSSGAASCVAAPVVEKLSDVRGGRFAAGRDDGAAPSTPRSPHSTTAAEGGWTPPREDVVECFSAAAKARGVADPGALAIDWDAEIREAGSGTAALALEKAVIAGADAEAAGARLTADEVAGLVDAAIVAAAARHGMRRAPFGGAHAIAYRDIGDVRVGFFGVCTQDTPNLSFPGPEVAFEDVFSNARECVRVLRGAHRCDCIVALTHVNIPQDREIVKTVAGIDLVLGGHDHHPFGEMVDRTLIFKTGHDAHWLGRVDVRVVVRGGAGRGPRCHFSYRLDANVAQDADDEIDAVLDRYRVVQEDGDAVLCDMRVAVDSTTSRARTQETSLPCVVADALRAILAAEIGVINGGFVRGDTEYVPGHQFTRADLARELPFPCPTGVIEIEGRYIRSALEEVLKVHPDLTGAFPHVSGLLIDWDPTAPAGSRIIKVTYEDGSPFDEDRTHSVALTTFMADGGDGITSWKHGTAIENPMPGARVSEVVDQYFKMYPVLSEIRNFGRRLRACPGGVAK